MALNRRENKDSTPFKTLKHVLETENVIEVLAAIGIGVFSTLTLINIRNERIDNQRAKTLSLIRSLPTPVPLIENELVEKNSESELESHPLKGRIGDTVRVIKINALSKSASMRTIEDYQVVKIENIGYLEFQGKPKYFFEGRLGVIIDFYTLDQIDSFVSKSVETN